ncbi:type II toxin-antitoxin system CcdA family antitoxin [Quisquiliibacterium transsilvanicum]|uniref:Antitoxin CcdA n=1 Tax=Quisquiliibacterium transsilvanicum TaxID=1549638 RepID=A0A7W8HGV3_9BURK|nr:type II toxin-antitoxin system CcdA family antitoxin [Quisquiliibacterium transsilvanicum]MBB5271028.1 antitoxin CcdA [Quisquiliibacterium transsilvanicum]
MEHTVREQAAIYDVTAPKRAANVSVNADLLRRARELGVNFSAVLERALVDAVRTAAQQRWRDENREAIEAYNLHVERDGCFGDRLRSF